MHRASGRAAQLESGALAPVVWVPSANSSAPRRSFVITYMHVCMIISRRADSTKRGASEANRDLALPVMNGKARLPNSEYTARPWRIHEITPDFRREDVWALPASGTRYEFLALVQGFADGDLSQGSWLAHALWSIRWKVGALLGWDETETGLGERVPTLRQRLPDDLLEAPGPSFESLPFTSLYLIEDAFAAEIANSTMHGVMHLSWVP